MQIETVLHRATGTVHAWVADRLDPEYADLVYYDENDLVFGAYQPEEPSEFDSGPGREAFRYPPLARRHEFRRFKRNRAARRNCQRSFRFN